MEWKEFIVQISSAWAWPVVVGLVAYSLKDKIAEFLPRVEKLKHKDTEIVFGKALSEIVEKADDILLSANTIENDLKGIEEKLQSIIDILPNNVLNQAHALVENEVMSILGERLEKEKRSPLKVGESYQYLIGYGVNKETLQDWSKIKRIRISMLENKKLTMSRNEVESYLELSVNLASQLRKFRANNAN